MTIFLMFWVLAALGLFSGWNAAVANDEVLSYHLKMLGYGDADINAIVKGEKKLAEVDRALKLKLLGYKPDEAAALLPAPAWAASPSRRQLDPYPYYRPLVHRIALQNGVDPCLVMAVIKAESNFNTHAVSPASAAGLMQLMPGTATELGVQDRFDPVQNISAGTLYLAQCIQQFGDIRLALAAYNSGPTRVDRLNGVPDNPQIRQFIRRVLKYQKKYAAMARNRFHDPSGNQRTAN
jgi:soluble lytic murein transglycosylase-like protein